MARVRSPILKKFLVVGHLLNPPLLLIRWTMRLPNLPGEILTFDQSLDHFDSASLRRLPSVMF
jgi:hypothetical protein